MFEASRYELYSTSPLISDLIMKGDNLMPKTIMFTIRGK